MKITTDKVKQKTLNYKSSWDEHAHITITEWSNMEGYDVISSHGKGRPLQFSMCNEEMDAFRALIAAMNLTEQEEK